MSLKSVSSDCTLPAYQSSNAHARTGTAGQLINISSLLITSSTHLVGVDPDVLKDEGTVVEQDVAAIGVEGNVQLGAKGGVSSGGKGGANVNQWLRHGLVAQGGPQQCHVVDLVLWAGHVYVCKASAQALSVTCAHVCVVAACTCTCNGKGQHALYAVDLRDTTAWCMHTCTPASQVVSYSRPSVLMWLHCYVSIRTVCDTSCVSTPQQPPPSTGQASSLQQPPPHAATHPGNRLSIRLALSTQEGLLASHSRGATACEVERLKAVAVGGPGVEVGLRHVGLGDGKRMVLHTVLWDGGRAMLRGSLQVIKR
jgi:hypothetical protein